MIKKGNNKKKKGFTLIELIIVLAVMAIIALIAIPNFAAVRENSKAKADKQSCETVKRTVLMLVSDETIKVTAQTTVTYTTGGSTTSANPADATGLDSIEVKSIDEALKEVKLPQATKYTVTTENDVKTPVTGNKTPSQYSIVINTNGEIVVSTVAP
ncbi:MAG: prepilin-type N-terminal cleavage/methylation domain-containing protein [Clostridium sp.]|uniref:pilus assembly FimT family protein n=1 Tax=Clostridium sp. TaxID=1506 RepID=UPI0030242E53